MNLSSNNEILQACASLVDSRLLIVEEKRLLAGVEPLGSGEATAIREEVAAGRDVLGEAYMRVNAPDVRRAHGETYTPSGIVDSMIDIARDVRSPDRVVDVGCGSGRFAIACARAFPDARIVAVDASPIATLMCKATVCALGLESRVEMVLGDFTTVDLPGGDARSTLWIGNPPYVRHHDIPAKGKRWLARESAKLGIKASGLSGLHAYFVLSIAARAKRDDFGVLVTSAEWLDVKYGCLVRRLLTERLGLFDLRLHDKGKRAFQDADTTSAVFAFDVALADDRERAVVLSAEGECGAVRYLNVSELESSNKWSVLLTDKPKAAVPHGYVRLGDFARVHRGIVTGANKFWVRKPGAGDVEKFTIPVVSHARELMTGALSVEPEGLSRLVVLPQDLDDLPDGDAESVRSFIEEGEALGVDRGYVARSRKRWWSIPVGEPATILMTYMARRPPVFVANPEKVRALNVVHGIYPFVELSDRAVANLVDYLNSSVSQEDGRTYCGGLTKFEPREVESLWVPSPEMLEEGSWRS